MEGCDFVVRCPWVQWTCAQAHKVKKMTYTPFDPCYCSGMECKAAGLGPTAKTFTFSASSAASTEFGELAHDFPDDLACVFTNLITEKSKHAKSWGLVLEATATPGWGGLKQGYVPNPALGCCTHVLSRAAAV